MPCANGIWSVGRRNRNEDFEMSADGAAAGCDLAAGKGAEFEICDTGLGVWVNDVNIIWNEKEAGQWEMRPNALLLCLFGTNCNIFLFSTVWLIWNSHFKLATFQ